MRTLDAYASLAAIDMRNVARDPLLRWILILTPVFGVLVRFAVPPIAEAVHSRFGVDLGRYYPLIMSCLPLIPAGLIGTVIGFLLLDQRDDETLTALLVTPLSLGDYLRYRMLVLLVLSSALSCVTMPVAGLTATTFLQVVVTAIVAAPLAPIYALFLGTFATNKVQGFALVKAAGIVLVPCIVAYLRGDALAVCVRTSAALLGDERLLAIRCWCYASGILARIDRARVAGGIVGVARASLQSRRQAIALPETATPNEGSPRFWATH